MNELTDSSTSQPEALSVLLISSRGLEPYTSLLANSLARYVQVVVFGDSRKYLSGKILFIQRATTLQEPPRSQKASSGSSASGALFWIVHDFVKYAVDAYYLHAVIQELKPKFIHLQGHFPFFYSLTFGPLLEKNFFWTIHDVELREARFGVMDRINVFLTWMTVMPAILGIRSKAIIVLGDALKRKMSQSWWASGKTYSILHGNYNDVYDPPLTPKSETPTALFFGKIKPYKGLDLFIQCAANVSRKIPSARFVIAGTGDLSPYLNLINKAGQNLFEIRNYFIPEEEIPMLFRRTSVAVLPYTKGSQSGVLALAYTMGVPVVASKIGSIPEVIDHGKTGFVFEPGNVAEMSDYVCTLLANGELCKEFSKNARQKASLALSWEEIAKKTLNLYFRLGTVE